MRLGQFISIASSFTPSAAPTPPVAGAWDLTYASFNGGDYGFYNVSASSGQADVEGLFFKPDGTKMYTVEPVTDRVYEYDLSTPWVLSSASLVQSFLVSGQDTAMYDLFFKPDGTKMYLCGVTNDSVYEYNLSTAWDISTAVFSQSFNTSLMVPNPISVFFKSDGTKMIVTSQNSGYDASVGYALSTAWDISTASYDIRTGATTGGLAYVGDQEGNPFGMFWKPDGAKVYIIGDSGDDVNEYALSTPWDLQTISFTQSFSVSAQATVPEGVFFRSDGLKMYVVASSTDAVYEYDLSTAWDVSTASYSTKSFSVATQQTTPTDLFFKADGTKMYVVGWTGANVSEYDLSTAWDVSTASFLQSQSVSAQIGLPEGLFFKSDGTKMYVCGISSDRVSEYNLGTAWDVTSATHVSSVNAGATGLSSPYAVSFDSTGTRMYLLHPGFADAIQGYTLGTGWSISTATSDLSENFFVDPVSISTEKVRFSDDGLTMISRDDVYLRRRTLSTAWDVATASSVNSTLNTGTTLGTGVYLKAGGTQIFFGYSGITWDSVVSYTTGATWDLSTATWDAIPSNYFNVSSEETTPYGVAFKSDGLKMYVIGSAGDDINEYNLSTAWDVTTASFVQAGSVSAQDTAPKNIFFKPDGTKLYVPGDTGNDINEYDLTTAWDISTLSFVQSLAAGSSSPTGVFFTSDGLTMFMCGGTSTAGEVAEFALSTAWDISTATETQSISLWFSAQSPGSDMNAPTGIFFKPDGTKMFLTASSLNVAEFALSTAWDISTATRTLITTFPQAFPELVEGMYFKPDGTRFFTVSRANTLFDAVYAFDVRE